MTFKVTRRLLEHRGGTKFYQLFHIMRHDLDRAGVPPGVRRQCTLTHWGKSHLIHGSEARPVNGGQTQLLGGGDFTKKSDEKRKRGYQTGGADRVDSFPTTEAFKEWCVSHFGAEQSHEIFVLMSLIGPGERLDTADDPGTDPSDPETLFGAKRKPKPAREDSTIARPESWGAW